jgi:hypothetical protein
MLSAPLPVRDGFLDGDVTHWEIELRIFALALS